MKLNLEVWNSKRLEVEAKIKAIKASLHTPGHYGTWKEYSDLKKLKAEATGLYMLRAELKNRLHCKTFIHYLSKGVKGKTVKVTESFSRAEQAALVLSRLEARP